MLRHDVKKDFYRELVCLLGIPFDIVNLPAAVEVINQSSRNSTRCILSTPNVNFVINAQRDAAFLKSVIHSDLNVVDGMPLVWFARFLGLPLKQRVAGSDLLDYLYHQQKDPLTRVFFFGGEKGIAEQASAVVNQKKKGLMACGFFDPGFCAIEEMSTPQIIQRINASQADFLILALGAQKGQSWIEKNKALITIPVISHLGAALNFITGSIKRSPVFFQKTGLEWLWRIYQEPKLWKRYFFDAVKLLQLFLFRVLPYSIWQRFNKPDLAPPTLPDIDVSRCDDTLYLEFSGSLSVQHISSITDVLYNAYQKQCNLIIDFSKVSYIDAFVIAKLLVLQKNCEASGLSLQLVNLSKKLKKIFYWNCVEKSLKS